MYIVISKILVELKTGDLQNSRSEFRENEIHYAKDYGIVQGHTDL